MVALPIGPDICYFDLQVRTEIITAGANIMIVEMRSYLLKPRAVPAVEERIGAALATRTKYSKLGGFWHTEVGTLNTVIHIWPWESFAHREQVRAELAKEKN